ncbi:MAG: hypothetical protein PVG14_18830, partial [Anaerolineales bacterium]
MNKRIITVVLVSLSSLLVLILLFAFMGSTRSSVAQRAMAASLKPDLLTISQVIPSSAPNDIDSAILIQGSGFTATISGTQMVSAPTVYLGEHALPQVIWGNTSSLSATVPWGLVPDIYSLTVVNPDGISTTLPGAFTITNGIGVWTTGGPYGGKANFIAQHPVDHQVLYAGAQWVGIFRSQDAGATWEPI